MIGPPQAFSLVNPDNKHEIFAVGLELGDEAVTYRDGNQFGTHSSAFSALLLYSKITELRLVWTEDWDDEPIAA